MKILGGPQVHLGLQVPTPLSMPNNNGERGERTEHFLIVNVDCFFLIDIRLLDFRTVLTPQHKNLKIYIVYVAQN